LATILVVASDPAVRGLLAAFLRTAGHRILMAESGAAALGVFAEQGPLVDLLITDLALPDLSGKALAGACQVRRPALHVLFLTGGHHLQSAEALEEWRLTAKTSTRGELLAAVDRALRASAAGAPADTPRPRPAAEATRWPRGAAMRRRSTVALWSARGAGPEPLKGGPG
jgi:DNA-binding NtrC family response regulator